MRQNAVKVFKLQLLLSVAVVFLLSACSQTPSTSSSTSPLSLESPPEQWTLKAKLGIRSEEGNGSITLNWQQQNQRYQIQLQTSLGQGNATIYGDNSSIVIERPGKPPLFSADASGLIKETFGWSLPMDNLSYWIRGIANPELPVQEIKYGPNGSLLNLEQSDWHLSYSRYQQVGQWQLPGKIRAKRKGTQLTLIVREWVI